MSDPGRLPAVLLVGVCSLAGWGADAGAGESYEVEPSFSPQRVIEAVSGAYRAQDGEYVADLPGLRVRYSRESTLRLEPRRTDRSSAPGWSVRTAELRRGKSDFLVAEPRVQIGPAGELRVQRPHVEERIERAAAGVHQAWHFERRPPGRGALVVSVEIPEGMAEADGHSGWRLEHTRGTASLRYGRATWVDGQGRRTPIRGRTDGSRITMEVPEEVLARSVFPATLDPLISPEFGMDDPVSAPTYWQGDHDVGFDGTNFLVVWSGTPGVSATRVTPLGEVLDVPEIQVGGVFSGRPAVAFDGAQYLIAYVRLNDVYTRQLDPVTGAVGPENLVSTDGQIQQNLDVAWNGTTSLVVWGDNFGVSPHQVRAARVTTTGQTIDTSRILVAQESGYSGRVVVDCNPASGECLLVWQQEFWGSGGDNYDLHGARVSAAGVVLDTTPFVVGPSDANRQTNPVIAFDGTRFAVVYQEPGPLPARANGQSLVRVATDGTTLDATPIRITEPGSSPSIAWNGTSYLVAWQNCGGGACEIDLFGRRISPEGVILDAAPITLAAAPREQVDVGVGAGVGIFLATYSDHRKYTGTGVSTGDGSAVRIDGGGAVLEPDPIDLTPVSNEQVNAAVASDGKNYLVAWQDERFPSGPDIIATRVTPHGEILDPGGIPIAVKADVQAEPDMAFDGKNYLVVFEDWDGGNPVIRGVRVTPEAVVLDPTPLLLSGGAVGARKPAVAWNGDTYLVVWPDLRNSDGVFRTDTDVYGARITPDLVPLDLVSFGIAVEATSGGLSNSEETPDVAALGGSWLVVWRDTNGVGLGFDIDGRIVNGDGTLAGTEKLPISRATGHQLEPAIAASSLGYLAVWEDSRAGASTSLYATRLNPDGGALDPDGIQISTGSSTLSAPELTWDGTSYLVVWQDDATGSSDILGTRVDETGAVDPRGVLVADSAEDELRPALATDGLGRSLIAYHRFVAEIPFFATRVRGRIAGSCGDRVRDPGEECDDGNGLDGDGCSAFCLIEFCGDGAVQPGLGEQCDDGNSIRGDGCSPDCLSERCGDVNDDDLVDGADVTRFREFLADPTGLPLSAAAQNKCKVILDAPSEPRPCDVLDVAVLRRALEIPPLPPGIAPVCPVEQP